MITTLVPADTVAVDSRTDPAEAWLFDSEEALLTRAVNKRRREFTTVRHCARQALDALGVPAAPLLPGAHGAPQWPVGIVGSMTHCEGYRAAAAASAEKLLTIGIDAEPHGALPGGVLDIIALPEEIKRLNTLLTLDSRMYWDRILFSCKESVYKAWYPLTGSWLGFEDADVVLDPHSGEFHARLLIPGPPVEGTSLNSFTGHWLIHDDIILTTITPPRISRRRGSE